jgi:DHA1 family inner membrane transport protein
MFAAYSYIAPSTTELTGFPSAAVPVILAVYGIGMTTGAFLSGCVAEYGLMRGIFFCLAAIAVILALFGFAAHHGVTAVLAVFLLGMVPTILIPMLQTRLMDVAAISVLVDRRHRGLARLTDGTETLPGDEADRASR